MFHSSESETNSSANTLGNAALWQAAWAVLVGTLLLRLAGGLASSSLSLYLNSQKIVGAEVGYIAAGYYASELLLAPLFGALTDRLGRKPLMAGAPLVGAVALVLYLFVANNPTLLFLVRFLEGISAAMAIPATLGYLSDLTDGSVHRARIMGLFEIVTLIGLAIGGLAVGPLVYQLFGVGSFPALALVYVLGALVFWFFLPNVGLKLERRRGLGDYVRALGNVRLLRFMPAWVAATGVIGLWQVHVQNQLASGKGLERVEGQALVASLQPAQISLPLGLFAAAFLAGLFFWGTRAKVGRRTTPMLYAGFGLLGVALGLFMLNHPEWGWGLPGQVWFAVLLLGAFFQAGFTPVALAYLADISEDFPQDRGVVMGLYSIFLAGGNLIGGGIGGLFVERLHMDGVVLVTLLFTAVAFISVAGIRVFSSD